MGGVRKKLLGGGEEGMSRARLSMRDTKKADLVTKARNKIAFVKKNKDYPNEPEIQAATAVFEAAADALDKTNGRLFAVRKEEQALLSTQALEVADLKRAAKMMLAVVELRTRGSKMRINEWGFEVASAAPPIIDAPPPPQGLRVTVDRQLHQVVRWDAVIGHRGYILQLGRGDGKNPQWDTPIHPTRASYVLEGFKPGELLNVRVAVRRPSGESAFADSIQFTVR